VPQVRPAAPESASQAPQELFLNADQAQRPVDLRGEIETGAPPADRAQELSAAVERLQAEAQDRPGEQAVLKEIARGLRRGGLQLPPMPQVILRVHRLIDSGQFNMEDLARGIELDPALATKMVGIANSPFYAGLEPAQSVRDAIVRIGMLETRNILMAIMLRSRVFRVPGFESVTQGLWEHALAASVTTRVIATQARMEPDMGFLGGLVHDVGRAVILSFAGDVRRSSRGALQPQEEELHTIMGVLHAQMGAIVTDSWHLGEELAAAIVHHHDPAQAPESAQRFSWLLCAGDELAKQLAQKEEGDAADDGVAAALQALGLDPELRTGLLEEAREEFEELGKVL